MNSRKTPQVRSQPSPLQAQLARRNTILDGLGRAEPPGSGASFQFEMLANAGTMAPRRHRDSSIHRSARTRDHFRSTTRAGHSSGPMFSTECDEVNGPVRAVPAWTIASVVLPSAACRRTADDRGNRVRVRLVVHALSHVAAMIRKFSSSNITLYTFGSALNDGGTVSASAAEDVAYSSA